ncbi:hypothetical protein [Roseateles violae]|uniref:Uncharacterized protein n=1 Tax=Roseateles violae TaxID=3058042 RepID=A0ABT8DSA2_9BURK|nr:hypothetical protein [Pelomonas sp. PFR6]MDN3921200.1 hypothetical protein [Pelomonas sp. PFR6]
MPEARTQIKRGGINRAGLRHAGAPAPVRPEPPRPAPPAPPPPPGLAAELARTTLQVIAVSAGLLLAGALVLLVRDSMAVGAHLAEAKNERTTLVCQNGRMTHGDGSLYDRLFARSYFVCTEWRTLQAIELMEKPR